MIDRLSSSGAALAVATSLVALGGCAHLQHSRFEAPEGTRAFGLEFGFDRGETEKRLRSANIEIRESRSDAEVLLVDRCPGAPAEGACRLFFGAHGLYAAQVEVPAERAKRLADAVRHELGNPDRADAPAAGGDAPSLVAGWNRSGWTILVTNSGTGASGYATCRVEYDEAAPPVVAGIRLGLLREEIERSLETKGALVMRRDETSTTYLGCPEGSTDALSCIVLFRDGRAAAVTEVHPVPIDDRGALAAWRLLSNKLEKEIGRPPETVCPTYGPERIEGDCTSSWASDRLVIVVGAHRNAGSSHRGSISLYTAFTYPPLGGTGEEEEAEERTESR